MAKEKKVSVLIAVREEFSKVFPRIGRVIRAVRRDLKDLKTPAGVVRVAFRNVRRAGRGLITSFRRIRSAAGRLRRALLSVRSVVGLLFAAFVVGRGIRSLLETVEALDRLAKTADKLGILPERLAELRFAAEQSGVALTALDLGLQRMIRRVAEAAVGTGEAQGALRDLGLDAEELARQSPDQIFLAISEAMLKVKDEGERIRLTFKLFDTEGVALKNTLALGADELERLFVQARALGLTLDRDQLRIVERLNDAVNRLRRAWQGLKQTLAISVAPALTKLIDDLTLLVVLLPKLIGTFGDTIAKAFDVGDEGQASRDKIKDLLDSIVMLFKTAAFEAARIFAVTLQQALIFAVRGIGPELTDAFNTALFRATEDSVFKFGKLAGPALKKQLEKELAVARNILREVDSGALDLDRPREVGLLGNVIFDFTPEGLKAQIAKIETELDNFDAKLKLRDRNRQVGFKQQLEALTTVVSETSSEAGEAVSSALSNVLDGLKEITGFDKFATPDLIADLRAGLSEAKLELDEALDLDAGQTENLIEAIASIEKLIDLREAEVAGNERRVAVLQQEIRQTAELVQLRANLAKSGEGQSEQAQDLIERLTDLQAAERRSLDLRLAAQAALDRVLEAEGALRRAIQDRDAAVALGVITQQTAIAAHDAQAEALRALATEARNTIIALGGGEELQDFVRQIDDVLRNLQGIAAETGGIFGGIKAGLGDFITEASNQFRNFQQLTTDLLGNIRGGFAGIFSGLIRGTEDVAMAFENMLFRMLDQVIVFLTDQIILQFLKLFTAEGVLGQALLGFTNAIGLGGIGEGITGGAAAGVVAIEGGAEAGLEIGQAVALEANTLALAALTTTLGGSIAATTTNTAATTSNTGVVGVFGGLFNSLKSILGGVVTAAASLLGAIGTVIIELIANTVELVINTAALLAEAASNFFGGLFGGGGGQAAGGFISGQYRGGDTVPAMLTPGEFVIRRQSAQWYGRSIMEAVNRRLIPRSLFHSLGTLSRPVPVAVPAFAAGGQVQAGGPPAPSGPILAVIVPDEQSLERLLAGGENAMMRFLEEHATAVSALIDRNRGLP